VDVARLEDIIRDDVIGVHARTVPYVRYSVIRIGVSGDGDGV